MHSGSRVADDRALVARRAKNATVDSARPTTKQKGRVVVGSNWPPARMCILGTYGPTWARRSRQEPTATWLYGLQRTPARQGCPSRERTGGASREPYDQPGSRCPSILLVNRSPDRESSGPQTGTTRSPIQGRVGIAPWGHSESKKLKALLSAWAARGGNKGKAEVASSRSPCAKQRQ